MKRYQGRQTPNGYEVLVIEPSGSRDLDPRYDLRNHSPDGFSWGFNGSGPAQLSLALLADALGSDERAQQHYQSFKFKVVGRLDGTRFDLSQEEIRQAVSQIEAERGRGR